MVTPAGYAAAVAMESSSTTRSVSRPAEVATGRRLFDVVLPFASTAVTLLALMSSSVRFPGTVHWYHWWVAPALGLLLVVRRASPLLVLIASCALVFGYYAAGGPVIGLELPLAAAFFSAAERGRIREAFTVAAVVLVIAYGYRMATQGGFLRLAGIEALTSVVVLAGAIGAGDAVRSRARERTAQRERARLVARHREDELQRSIDAERRALARDVHDVLGHAMVVISTQASVAAESLDDSPELARQALGHIRDTARQSVQEVRSALTLLRAGESPERTPAASLDLLDGLIERVRDTGLTVTLDRSLGGVVLPATVSATTYRIIQEALTNVIRHADARAVRVSLVRRGDLLVVDVEDDGTTAPGWEPGSGVRGMMDRAAAVGGELAAGPQERGFRVHAEVPIPGVRR